MPWMEVHNKIKLTNPTRTTLLPIRLKEIKEIMKKTSKNLIK